MASQHDKSSLTLVSDFLETSRVVGITLVTLSPNSPVDRALAYGRCWLPYPRLEDR